MKSRIAILLALAALALAAGTAHADPPPWADPHYPDRSHGQCVGGHGAGFFVKWCDGQHYPDNSYWRQMVDDNGKGAPMACLLDDGSPTPPPAPHGGCAGAV